MVFMRKFLLLILLLSTFAVSEEDQQRDKFLLHYYRGDYDKAHNLLNGAFQNSTTRIFWEHRLHQNQDFTGCANYKTEQNSAEGIALLRRGSFQEAKQKFTDDWISKWGQSMVSLWENHPDLTREYINQALALSNDYPEVLFFAADVASTVTESIDYFTRYLHSSPEDRIKMKVAEYGIEFMKKTQNMELNVISFPSSPIRLDSNYRDSRLTLKARVNGKQSTLLLDTGAGGLTLQTAKWEPQIESDLLMFGLGKTQVVKTKRVVLNHFQAGEFNMKNPVAAINDSLPGGGIEGVAGAVLFSNQLILLPFTHGKKMALFPQAEDPMELLKANGYKFSHQETLPFYIVHKMMILKGQIRNSPPDMDILLDTGAESSVLSAATARKYTRINYPLSYEANKNHTFSGIGGRVDNVLLAENVGVRLGKMEKNYGQMLALNLADTCEGMDLEIDMILGRDFLESYSLLIDYRNNRVTFLR